MNKSVFAAALLLSISFHADGQSSLPQTITLKNPHHNGTIPTTRFGESVLVVNTDQGVPSKAAWVKLVL